MKKFSVLEIEILKFNKKFWKKNNPLLIGCCWVNCIVFKSTIINKHL